MVAFKTLEEAGVAVDEMFNSAFQNAGSMWRRLVEPRSQY